MDVKNEKSFITPLKITPLRRKKEKKTDSAHVSNVTPWEKCKHIWGNFLMHWIPTLLFTTNAVRGCIQTGKDSDVFFLNSFGKNCQTRRGEIFMSLQTVRYLFLRKRRLRLEVHHSLPEPFPFDTGWPERCNANRSINGCVGAYDCRAF